MSILIFAIIIVIVAALLIWAVRSVPMTQTLNTILSVAIILIAAILIIQRAGLLA